MVYICIEKEPDLMRSQKAGSERISGFIRGETEGNPKPLKDKFRCVIKRDISFKDRI